MSFFLVKLEPDGEGNMIDVPIPDYGPYEKGGEAAKAAKDLSTTLGYKVQPRRIHQAPDWRARQKDRLTRGVLPPLPEIWAQLEPVKDHFAHLGSDAARVAFTENDELGTIDRVTLLNPGRYLTRFYENQVNDDLRRQLIASIDPSGEILYATSIEDITRTYKEGPSSCMDGTKNFSNLPCWPSTPYAAGDLSVAYSMNNRGRISARCICWPAKKLFGRVFGDHQRMIPAMEGEGFTYIRERNDVDGNSSSKCFDGARLLKIRMERTHFYVMPYFDDVKFAMDMGDHFITVLEQPPGKPGARYCHTGGTGGHVQMYLWCPKMEEYHFESDFRFVKGADEDWSAAARRAYAFLCEGTDEYWSDDELVHVQIGSMQKKWSKLHFAEHGEVCEHSNKNYPRDEMITLSTGMRVHNRYCTHLDGKDVLQPSHDWIGRNSKFLIQNDAGEYVSFTEVADIPRYERRPQTLTGIDFGSHDVQVRLNMTDEVRLQEMNISEMLMEQTSRQLQQRMQETLEIQLVGDQFTRRFRVA